MKNKQFMPRISLLLGVLALLASGVTLAAVKHPGAKAFAARVASQHDVSEQHILQLLDKAERKQSIIDAMRRPAEALPWHDYRDIFLTSLRIRGGIAFYKTNKALLQQVAQEYGVDPQYIVAILGVESNYGTNTGNYRVLDALVTLAFHYPPREDFFRGELETLLTMPATQLPGPLLDIHGSYAGAMGWGQFMPSSIQAYARDEDDDGHIDLVLSMPDIFASIANYLAQHGWQHGQPVAIPATRGRSAGAVDTDHSETIYTAAQLEQRGYQPNRQVAGDTPATLLKLDAADGDAYWVTFNNFHVITRYNHSPLYAMAVTQLAKAIAAGVHATEGGKPVASGHGPDPVATDHQLRAAGSAP